MIIDPLDKFSIPARRALEEVFEDTTFRTNFNAVITDLWWNGYEELRWVDYSYFIELPREIEKDQKNRDYKLAYQSSLFPEKIIKVLQYKDIQWNLFIDYFGSYKYNLYVKPDKFFYTLLFSNKMFNHTPIEVVERLGWRVELFNRIKRIPKYEEGELVDYNHISSFTSVEWDKLLRYEIESWLKNNIHFSSYYSCNLWVAFEHIKDAIAFKITYY